MIKKICIEKYTLHFRKQFTIAYESVTSAPVVILHLHDENGRVGLGSAAPDSYVTGETITAVLRILKARCTKKFFSHPREQWYRYHEKIQKVFKGYPAAQSAVEEAIFNLLSMKQHLSVSNFFGGYRKSCNAVITIGISGEEQTINEVKKRLQEGFSIMKLKCGNNVHQDIKKIMAVRNILPRNKKLLLDANQGYSFNDATQLLRALKKLDITGIEQPIAAKNIEGLKKLRSLQIVPIIADEAASDVSKTIRLLLGGYVDGINIKLMKHGGPICSAEVFHLAKRLGKLTILGCMYESNISITTGAHLALALPFDFVDLDSGHLDFYDDPTRGGASVENGEIKIKGLVRLITSICAT